MNVVRGILGFFAGLIVAWLFVFGAEAVTHRLYPFPPHTDMHDMTTIKNFVATLPIAAFIIVLAGWFFATLLGTYTASSVGRSRVPGIVLAVLLLFAGIMNARVIPQPGWFTATSIAIYLLVPLAGIRLASPARRVQPEPLAQ